jgi:hypothetical protein
MARKPGYKYGKLHRGIMAGDGPVKLPVRPQKRQKSSESGDGCRKLCSRCSEPVLSMGNVPPVFGDANLYCENCWLALIWRLLPSGCSARHTKLRLPWTDSYNDQRTRRDDALPTRL